MILEAVLAIALTCRTLPPSLAPIMAGIAMHESGGDLNASNHNSNGTTDYGLAQINSSGFGWLSESMTRIQGVPVVVNEKTVLDPCLNLTAGALVLFRKYNGNPPDSIKALYTAGVMTQLSHLPPVVSATQESTPPPCAPSWDAWALAACSSKPADNPNPTVTAQEKTAHAN